MQPAKIAPKDRLIVALDLPGVADAEAMIAKLGDSVNFYKIGYQLGYAGGLPLARQLADSGKKVFLDLKLHDIGNTVARGVESVAKLGATFLTVHAYPQTMKAAVEARAGLGLKILAVTVLTLMTTAISMPPAIASTCPIWSKRAPAGAGAWRRRAGELAGRGGLFAQDRRAPDGTGDAGHPAGGCGERRPEAHHDAGAGNIRRRGLSGGRTAGYRGRRSQGGGRRHSGRKSRRRWAEQKGERRWQRLLDRAHRFHNMDGYKEYIAQNGAVFNKFGAKFLVRGGAHETREGSSRSRNVVLEFKDYANRARLLQLAGIRPAGRDPQAALGRRSRDHRRL